MATQRLIGSRIRDRRNQLGLSGRELAKLIGVSQGTVVAYEKGDVDPPSSRLYEIARTLNTSVAYLFGETDDPGPYAGLQSTLDVSDNVLSRLTATERFLLEVAGRKLAKDLIERAEGEAAEPDDDGGRLE